MICSQIRVNSRPLLPSPHSQLRAALASDDRTLLLQFLKDMLLLGCKEVHAAAALLEAGVVQQALATCKLPWVAAAEVRTVQTHDPSPCHTVLNESAASTGCAGPSCNCNTCMPNRAVLQLCAHPVGLTSVAFLNCAGFTSH